MQAAPTSSCGCLERKTEEEKFQQVVYVNYELDEFFYLLDVIQSVCDVVISNQTVCPIV